MNKRGRIDRKDKEFSQNQKLANENRALKKTVAQLQRQLDKLEHNMKMGPREPKGPVEPVLPKVKPRPCFKCGEGFLQMVKYDRAGEEYYYRQCSECDHRTRGQKYTESVKE